VFRFVRELLAIILRLLRIFYPALIKRANFEQKNLLEVHPAWTAADYCFHVSSEGELEQVMPLINLFLQQQKRIELIFTSPSVEHRVLNLRNKFPHLLAVLRMPLVSYHLFAPKPLSVFKWVTAPTIFYCRYDFYPEMMLLKKNGKKFILLNATSKNLKVDSLSLKWNYYRYCYSLMDMICAPIARDVTFFKEFFPAAEHFEIELRVLQIQQRLENAEYTLINKIPFLSQLKTCLQSVERNHRFIFGSFWMEEAFLVEELLSEMKHFKSRILIVPHDLSHANLQAIQSRLQANLPDQANKILMLDENTREIPPDVCVLILNLKGVLLELYSLFGHAFVGGGFGVSIHSVLEPFLAKSKVMCGPKVNRSTEFDMIQQTTHKLFPKIIEYPGELTEYIKMINQRDRTEIELSQSVESLLILQKQQMLKFKERVHC
jgi:3-deoxy-D-manno-octulosonic-acid transferase